MSTECNDIKYRDIFDINKYKKYVRDTLYYENDEDLYDLIEDVFYEICSDTRIFKDIFAFRISNDENTYSIRAIYDINQYLSNNKDISYLTSVTVDTITEEQAKDFLMNPIIEPSGLTYTYSDNVCLNDYRALIDLIYYDENKRTSKSILHNWFSYVNDDVYRLNLRLNDNEYYDIIAIVSIIPNINNIDTRTILHLKGVCEV
jgi:hypothetical protein